MTQHSLPDNDNTPPPDDQAFELLSAYLDDALPTAERADLEARLTTDPTLRAELQALRETVTLLQALPPLQAPRDFTLTPADVESSKITLLPRQSRRWLWTALGSVAALVVVLVAAVYVVGVFDGGGLSTADRVEVANAPTHIMPTATSINLSPQEQVVPADLDSLELETANQAPADSMGGAAVSPTMPDTAADAPPAGDMPDQAMQAFSPTTLPPPAAASDFAVETVPQARVGRAPAEMDVMIANLLAFGQMIARALLRIVLDYLLGLAA
jgi:anti-sigma factor RsiW